MAHDVFISHTSEDKRVVDAFTAALEAEGVRCWIAPRDATPGGDAGAEVLDALTSSDVMLLVFSAAANESPHVKKQLSLAIDGGVTVVPVKIDDTPLEGMVKYHLVDTHWLDVMDPPTEREIGRVVRQVKNIVAPPEPVEAVPAAPEVETEDDVPASRSRVWVLATLLAVVVVAAALVWAPWSEGESPGGGATLEEPAAVAVDPVLSQVGFLAMDDAISDIDIVDGAVYVAMRDDGLAAVSLADPAAPAELWRVETEARYVTAIRPADGTAVGTLVTAIDWDDAYKEHGQRASVWSLSGSGNAVLETDDYQTFAGGTINGLASAEGMLYVASTNLRVHDFSDSNHAEQTWVGSGFGTVAAIAARPGRVAWATQPRGNGPNTGAEDLYFLDDPVQAGAVVPAGADAWNHKIGEPFFNAAGSPPFITLLPSAPNEVCVGHPALGLQRVSLYQDAAGAWDGASMSTLDPGVGITCITADESFIFYGHAGSPEDAERIPGVGHVDLEDFEGEIVEGFGTDVEFVADTDVIEVAVWDGHLVVAVRGAGLYVFKIEGS